MRISLKSSLLVLAILGAGAGLLGRLFMTNPPMFFRVSSILVTIVPFLAAIVTIGWISRRQRSRALGIWTILLLLTPPIGMCGILMLQSAGRGSQGLGVLSNQQILNVNLPKAIDQPWVWRELESRVNSGDFSSEEVDMAYQTLAAHLKKQTNIGPLSWQREFLKAVATQGLGTDEELIALCDVVHGQATAKLQGSRFIQVKYGNTWGDTVHSGLGLTLLWKVTEVLVDGKPLSFKSAGHNGTFAPLDLESPLPFDKKVTMKIDCAYVPSDKMIGLNIKEPQDGVMPAPLKRWTQTISIESPVTLTNASLVTAPKKNPASEIGIERLVVQNEQANQVANGMGAPNVPNAIHEANRKKLALKTGMGPGLEVDMVFDVFIHIDESTMVNMGHISFHHHEDGNSSFRGSLLTGAIDQLDDDVTAVDIEFVPDLEHANKAGIFKEIWGNKIMLYDVPIERLDLESR